MHSTAVYEDSRGKLYTLKLNGLQPKSVTDLSIVWSNRMMANCIIQSGKTLRDEPKALSYEPKLENLVNITWEEYQEAFRRKSLAVLTRRVTPELFEENEIYKAGIFERITFYAKETTLNDDFCHEMQKRYRVYVHRMGKRTERNKEAFTYMIGDLKKETDGLTTIECGSTVTAPMYNYNEPLGRFERHNPVDVLFLSRYQGVID